MPAFEDVDEEFVVSSEPYLYEPEYTDEELIKMDAQRVERESSCSSPCWSCSREPGENIWRLVVPVPKMCTNADIRQMFLLQGVGLGQPICSFYCYNF